MGIDLFEQRAGSYVIYVTEESVVSFGHSVHVDTFP